MTQALRRNSDFLQKKETLWDMREAERLEGLYALVKAEQKKEDGGIFRDEIAKSYWRKGFCSAAVKKLATFLLLSDWRESILDKFHVVNEAGQLIQQLESIRLPHSPLLLHDADTVDSHEGKTALRQIETRQNQYVFRQMMLENYQSQCCLTGLPLPEALRASHISPWAKDKKNRLNPENGLCLSATYDAAFDRKLISLDEDYRLILAPALKKYYTNKAFQAQFKSLAGKQITLPKRFLPSQSLLSQHRRQMP